VDAAGRRIVNAPRINIELTILTEKKIFPIDAESAMPTHRNANGKSPLINCGKNSTGRASDGHV
jgi:hypothetical protein